MIELWYPRKYSVGNNKCSGLDGIGHTIDWNLGIYSTLLYYYLYFINIHDI